jgi:hypothetical protein
MAINVDTVYKTVLLILNKEQRGYMTPEEFNKTAAQAQLEIFEKYFEDLNQLNRTRQDGSDYSDRIAYLDQKISIFKETGVGSENDENSSLTLPANLHVLGAVSNSGVEVQRVLKNEYYNLIKSDLTKPSANFPVYVLKGKTIQVFGASSLSGLELDYIRKPVNPEWNYRAGSLGQFLYNDSNADENPSVDFEIHASEQTEIILKILIYAGVIVKDSGIVQVAASQVQKIETNQKS